MQVIISNVEPLLCFYCKLLPERLLRLFYKTFKHIKTLFHIYIYTQTRVRAHTHTHTHDILTDRHVTL